MVSALKKLIPARLRRLIGPVLARISSMRKPLSLLEFQDRILSAVALREQGYPSAGEALLQRTLNGDLRAHAGLPRDYIREFLTAVEQRRSFVGPGDDDAADSVTRHTQSLDVACLPCRRWLILHWACIHNGLFKAGGVAREKAVEAAYEEASGPCGSVDCLVQAFKAGIEQGDFRRAEPMLERLRSSLAGDGLIGDLEAYLCLNRGDILGFLALSSDKLNEQDRAFEDYIKGKSVAIVGPAPSGEEVGAEIDSFDVVIRFTYRGEKFAGDPKEFGRRTDVSYVNVEIGRHMRDSEDVAFFDDLRFAVFRSLEHEFQRRLLESQRGRILKCNRFHFAGTAMALQNALFDVFHFEPRRVKLFHFNFFLARNYYHSGYAMTMTDVHDGTAVARARTTLLRWRSFAYHGLVNQLDFVGNLWRAGLVEADGPCEAVLRLTPAEYMAAMEEVWVINPASEYTRHLSENCDAESGIAEP